MPILSEFVFRLGVHPTLVSLIIGGDPHPNPSPSLLAPCAFTFVISAWPAINRAPCRLRCWLFFFVIVFYWFVWLVDLDTAVQLMLILCQIAAAFVVSTWLGDISMNFKLLPFLFFSVSGFPLSALPPSVSFEPAPPPPVLTCRDGELPQHQQTCQVTGAKWGWGSVCLWSRKLFSKVIKNITKVTKHITTHRSNQSNDIYRIRIGSMSPSAINIWKVLRISQNVFK